MRQKVVIKVCMKGEKSRSKALKAAVSVPGIESAALRGQDMDQIEVTGDEMDVVLLVKLLRCKLGFADLVSVAPIDDKKEGDKEKKKKSTDVGQNKPTVQPPAWFQHDPCGPNVPPHSVCEVWDGNYEQPPCCSII